MRADGKNFGWSRFHSGLVAFWLGIGSAVSLGADQPWQPFDSVRRPELPQVKNSAWARNPIDRFVAASHETRGLVPRPEAPKSVLQRRVYLDLIGLAPTPEEQAAFAQDDRPDAYEQLVERLLNDPRHGERWGRHWMDIWRYSDWAGWSGGNQIRDSKPHIWRWRDWIVESLNLDKPYNEMLIEMLAADELDPENPDALRATGYLARNFKLLSREQWLEDTVKHTAQAFLGLTVGCARCHDHAYDPIPQKDYFSLRAIFEPHQVRTDRLPGEPDTAKDGLVRVYDVATNRPTFLFIRGDERQPDTNQVVAPGVPKFIAAAGPYTDGEGLLRVEPVQLPDSAAFPDKRPFVIRDLIHVSERAVAVAAAKLERAQASAEPNQSAQKLELELAVARARHASLLATIEAEKLENDKESDVWKNAAKKALRAQQELAVAEARQKLFVAEQAKEKEKEGAAKKIEEAQKEVAMAETALASEPGTDYKPRATRNYPRKSTGRRLAFARWLADRENPLTARVAMNHVWLRHFGRGIVPTPSDFGRNGGVPTHPELLDWLAAEFMDASWSFKTIHRLIVTSATYRMASTPDPENAQLDPDNFYLWRMPSRRMEAELVRDNLLHAAGTIDLAMGGPDIDHKLGLTSNRRSLYLRIAAQKEVEFLKIFDGPAVTECYERRSSVMPHQALALGNSELAFRQARELARRLARCTDDRAFIEAAFQHVLGRTPSEAELKLCVDFLTRKCQDQGSGNGSDSAEPAETAAERARTHLMLVLFNHNDFVTIR